ncbi:MAG: site-specific DNA-methyltransferase, partial [Candidatus Izemoplasmatales bacterium]|nr:site-specific DNA-methyltransferase [Candidatus Izemoplasmatales bacterium]
MNKMEGTSLDLEKLNIEKIKELFPNVVTEGKVDFDKLRIILGDQIDDRVEKYQFTWNGKSDTIKLAQSPSTGTLIPSKEDSKNWDTTGNLYIEGDNLEVLKQLQKTYYGKVKMIYIDPPYNTGGDFVYKDDFKDNIKNYKEQTQQTSRANPETNGRYHTDWLNMMYSRLMLAKNLLAKDGVIFVSIDDNEVVNLKKVMEEIFGENNFIDIFSWKKTETPANLSKYTKKAVEYILAFKKDDKLNQLTGLKKYSKSSNGLMNQTNSFHKLVFPANYIDTGLANGIIAKGSYGTQNYEINLLKDTSVYNGVFTEEVILEGRFKWSQDYLNKQVAEGVKISIRTEALSPSYEKNEYSAEKPWNIIDKTFGVSTNESASVNLNKLLGGTFFDYPKPVSLIEYLVKTISEADYIMDFFSGSATTAHAVMKLNAEDGGNRKFIMVQLPELTDESSDAYKAGYKNLCEIGKERIRRAGEQIKQELIEKKNKAGLLDDNIIDPETFDNGFKVFKLDSTNINPWDGTIKLDETTIFSQTEVIKEDRSNLDVLYEIMLKYGVFDKPAKEIRVNTKTMYSVADGYLIVCLDNHITLEDVKEIGKLKPRNVIFKESGFANDNDKINATYTLEKLGVEEIK